ncbi:hypothetical protein R0769_13140 [Escherichia albertii]
MPVGIWNNSVPEINTGYHNIGKSIDYARQIYGCNGESCSALFVVLN